MHQETQLHQAFFKNLQESFSSALLAAGVVEKFFKIGGYKIHMQFAGDTLARSMTPSLEHLEAPPFRKSDLTIRLWDDKTTKIKTPDFPWEAYPSTKQAAIIKHLNTYSQYVSYNAIKRVLHVFDDDLKTGYFWVPDANKLPPSELSVPLKNIFHKFFLSQGVYLIHAGAVGLLSGGVLLVGKGGVGKSTTALSCLDSDLLYVGDDYVLMSKGKTPMIYSIYSCAKLHKSNMHRIPHLLPAAVNVNQQDKTLMFLHHAWHEKLASQFPLHAVFLPRITGNNDSKLVPATTKEAIHALTLSTVVQFPQTDPRAVRNIIKLIQHIPAYHLNLGTEMSQIPHLISKFLKESK